MNELLLSVAKEHSQQFEQALEAVGLKFITKSESENAPNIYYRVQYDNPNELYYLGRAFGHKEIATELLTSN